MVRSIVSLLVTWIGVYSIRSYLRRRGTCTRKLLIGMASSTMSRVCDKTPGWQSHTNSWPCLMCVKMSVNSFPRFIQFGEKNQIAAWFIFVTVPAFSYNTEKMQYQHLGRCVVFFSEFLCHLLAFLSFEVNKNIPIWTVNRDGCSFERSLSLEQILGSIHNAM